MKLVDRCSLKTQLILIVLWPCAVILLLNGALFMLYDLAQFRRERARELEVLGRLLAEHSAAPLVFRDARAATEVLAGMRSIPAVQIAALYMEDGRPFAWYLNDVPATALPAQLPVVHKQPDALHHVALVRWEGQLRGYVYLRASLIGWRERIIHYAMVGSSVILLSLGISILLIALLQRRITRPLDHLREVIRSVAETHDYAARVPVKGPVELRELATTFNEMLTRVQEHQAVLVAAKEAAEEMARLKSTFLANMNHEIRTPLTAVLGYAQILEEELEDPVHREMTQSIIQSGQRLLDTLDALLYMSRLEAGTVRTHYQNLDVVAITQAVVDELMPLACDKKLEFTLQSSEPALMAWVDEDLWRRLVKNLVHNAIKFTEKGRVTVLLEGDSETVQLQVADTGIGIPEELQSVIFDAFKQASSGLSRDYEGSGLGLTIVQRIVRLLSGQVFLESQPGVGSLFTVIIPRRPLETSGSKLYLDKPNITQI